MNILIGIDPGITGAFAVLNADTLELVMVEDMPVLQEKNKKRINAHQLIGLLNRWSTAQYHVRMIYLEKVHAMPKQGVTSMFSMGRSVGIIEGSLGALAKPLTYITPHTWKKRAGLIRTHKDQSRTRALELYPEAPLSRKKDHNRADAILIARYGEC